MFLSCLCAHCSGYKAIEKSRFWNRKWMSSSRGKWVCIKWNRPYSFLSTESRLATCTDYFRTVLSVTHSRGLGEQENRSLTRGQPMVLSTPKGLSWIQSHQSLPGKQNVVLSSHLRGLTPEHMDVTLSEEFSSRRNVGPQETYGKVWRQLLILRGWGWASVIF